MRMDFEERVVLNPVLGAVVLWSFISEYQKRSGSAHPPDLVLLLLVLPVVLHATSTEKLKRMRFDSGLAKAVAELPAICGGLRERVASYAPLTFTSLNVACASRLLERIPASNPPAFRIGTKLPAPIRPKGVAYDMASAARRLGAFFVRGTISQVQAQLGISL